MHYQEQGKQQSRTHFQQFQATHAPMLVSQKKRTVLRAEDILGDAAVILPSRKRRNGPQEALSGVPTLITSKEKLQDLRQAPLVDITHKLFSPVTLLPTRSAIGLLARLTNDTPLLPATTLVLPSTTIVLSRQIATRGLLVAIVGGGLESLAVLLFSRATQLISTGITSVLSSDYAVVSLIVGLIVFRERLNLRQLSGMLLILGGICLLALHPF